MHIELPHYYCHKTNNVPVIDGNTGNNAWDKAEPITAFHKLRINAEVALIKPVFNTICKLIWDDNYLYVIFDCKSNDVWATKIDRDGELWTEPVVELFIDQSGNGKSFFEFQVNPIGTIYDSYVADAKLGEDWPRWSKWNCKGLKVATHIDGRLNERSYKDNGWSAKIAIPFKSLIEQTGITHKTGDTWRINLCRYEIPAEIEKPELSCWAPTLRLFDDLSNFGYLHFAD